MYEQGTELANQNGGGAGSNGGGSHGSIVEDPNFWNAFKMLLWKDYKQQTVRRPVSTACRMLLPVLFIALLALIRVEYTVTVYDDSIWDIIEQDWYSKQSSSDEWYSTSVPILSENEWIKQYWLCYDNFDYSISIPAYSIAFVPNPFDDESGLSSNEMKYYQQLVALLNLTWTASTRNSDDSVNFTNCYDSYGYIPFEDNWLIKYFDSESELQDYVTSVNYGNGWNVSGSYDDRRPVGFAIVIKSISEDGTQWDYKLRMNSSASGDTNDKVDTFTRYYEDLYWSSVGAYSSFIYAQDWIDRGISFIIANQSGEAGTSFAPYLEDSVYSGNGSFSTSSSSSYYRSGAHLYEMFEYNGFPFPLTGFETDEFWADFGGLFFFFVLVQFVYPINVIVTVLVNEKAAKIAEGLKMMGATLASYWVSWISWFFVEMAIVSLLIAISGSVGQVFKYSDFGVIFMYFWSMTLALSGMSMLISTLFDNPKIASLFACMLWIVTLILGGFGTLMSESGKGWFCLIAPACINMSVNNLSTYEQALLGVQWDNINEAYDDFRFSTAIIMFWVDYVLYVALALYFDRVWPSRYGSRLPFYFLCLPSFWKGKDETMDKVQLSRQFSLMDTSTYEDSKGKYESMTPSIAIRKLKKYFEPLIQGTGPTVKAVDGISLDMYEGEVFCLLGHNGAGKTTTIGMLTGLLDITEGDAWILGSSVRDAMSDARKHMGVCPQHDVLFPLLTVREHLVMYARLKGVKPEFVQEEVDRTINDVGLKDKVTFYPTQLSGGQKRKLSLGIAFVGQSKIVFLDEPTSGMDPQARRVTWELIAREKQNRTIILTTHYMDEADFLGDRIAIMAGGKVRCCGSALFLKKLYGVGYTFTVSLKIGVKAIDVKEDIDKVVLKHVGSASLLSISGAEMNYRLPFAESGKFAEMFEELDSIENEVGINSYGVSVTTLEEVFLKIGHDGAPPESLAGAGATEGGGNVGADEASMNMNDDEAEKKTIEDADKSFALTGDAYDNPFPQPTFKLNIGDESTAFDVIMKEIYIFVFHCYAVLYRRFWWSVRDFRGICCQLFIPGCLAAMGLGVIKIFLTSSYPSLALDVSMFYSPVDEYGVPISNSTWGIIETDDSFLQTWDSDMMQEFGDLTFYETSITDGSVFTKSLMDHASDSEDYIHYYGWAFVNASVSTPTFSLGMNVSGIHSAPITLNAFRNWIARTKFNSNASISITNHPLPTTSTEDAYNDFFLGLFASLYLLLAFAFVPVGAVYQVVLDTVTQTKHQQFVSGMSLFSYWIGNYVADILNAAPAGGLVVLQVYIFETESFKGDAAGPFILAIFLFIFSITPFTYLLGFLFRDPSGAQRWTAILYIVLGIVLLITSWILDLNNVSANDDLKTLYQFFPTFLLSDAIYAIALRDLLNPGESFYNWDVCGKDFVYMVYEGFGYFALLLLIEWVSHQPRILQALGLIANKPKVEETLDEDVAKEQERIKSAVILEAGGSGTLDESQVPDSVVLAGLRKVYKNRIRSTVAVKDIWFGVPQGQVFGFLGVNGAGKTTTLAVLTGERHASEGTGFIHGYPITQQSMIRRFIGYCPQFDALFELLTGEEHLRFYGTLKGLRGQELDEQVDMLLKVLSLGKYRHRRAGTYSGGNKRKLSVAMSMIGNPPIIFLDEPSTGMDPVSRRHMWEFISKTMDGRAVILTTHSMEECEALCHRLAIQVDGQLRCIGTPQHIKSRFGHGYQLDLLLESGDDKVRADVEGALQRLFEVKCLEVNRHKATYEINEKAEYVQQHGKLTLAQLFKELESLKANKPIQSYAVNQTSLEQIFLKMAKGIAVANPSVKAPSAAAADTSTGGATGDATGGANDEGASTKAGGETYQ